MLCDFALMIAVAAQAAALPIFQMSNQIQLNEQMFNGGFKYMGSYGPYANGRDQTVGRDPPDGCQVDQMILLSRPGETYPSKEELSQMNGSLYKMESGNGSAYYSDFDSHTMQTSQDMVSQIISSGPHAGTTTMYRLGTMYRQMYGHLVEDPMANAGTMLGLANSSQSKSRPIPIYVDDHNTAAQVSAQEFARGFLGTTLSAEGNSSFDVKFVPSHDKAAGANSFAPMCNTAQSTISVQLEPFNEFQQAATRLSGNRKDGADASAVLNSTDVFSLMKLAAFQTSLTGYSPWIEMFTPDEWTAFQYYDDASHYYKMGPGLNTSAVTGSVFANATLNLIMEQVPLGINETATQLPTPSLALCFATSQSIIQFMNAIHLMCPSTDLPPKHIAHRNAYQMSEIVPMGGHLVIERLKCGNAANDETKYVRFVLNESVVPLDDCQSGPGYSCPVSEYNDKLNRILPVYEYMCQPGDGIPRQFTLFWDP